MNVTKTDIIDFISKSELSKEAKSIGLMGILFDAKPESIVHGMVSAQDMADTQRLNEESREPRLPRGLTETQKILTKMLWESTGSAMMDSGGAYGRHWQKNRHTKDFRDNEPITVKRDSWSNDLEISIDIFHYLSDRVEYDPLMQREFMKFCNKSENKEESFYALMSEFAEKMHDDSDQYDMMPKVIEGNSYNEENALSQTIQYACFMYNECVYALIQIHQGADVRGGYTDPKCFKLGDVDDAFRLFDWARINGSCDCDDCYTDDLYHWYDADLFDSKQWNYSTKHDAFFCKDCKSKVGFSC